MALLFYITHPQVNMDPAVPVPSWGLSDLGRQRAEMAAASQRFGRVTSIYSSTEQKAIELAEIIAAARGLEVQIRDGLHENDRSATGYLPAQEFEQVADQFFATPEASVRGWERAIDAQSRIVSGIEAIMAGAPDGDLIVTGHGGVGTLLYCFLSGLPISREFDQPAGGGNFFVVDRARGKVLHDWKACEALDD